MQTVPGGVPLSFEVTFDSPALDVAMSAFDDSGLTPSLVFGPSAMLSVVGNTYRGKFTPTSGKNYLIFKAVYTDGTFATLHPDYSQSSETIYAKHEITQTDIEATLDDIALISGTLEDIDVVDAEIEDNDVIE